MLPNGFASGIVISIALEVIHENKISHSEAPHSTDANRPVGIHFVNPPVIGPTALLDTFGRSVICSRLPAPIDTCRINRIGIRDTIFVGAEIDIMLRGLISRRPA